MKNKKETVVVSITFNDEEELIIVTARNKIQAMAFIQFVSPPEALIKDVTDYTENETDLEIDVTSILEELFLIAEDAEILSDDIEVIRSKSIRNSIMKLYLESNALKENIENIRELLVWRKEK
uniref:Uncharacterized protein n=1 Tax=viral metagenome TaxID=1070528 RepID=A0A6M3LE46_9ZZZZ